jgi:Flp pilus assembly pilin Flp
MSKKGEKEMRRLFTRFWKDEQGLELSEYALMIALIVVIAVLVITDVGKQISKLFGDLLTALGG